MKSVNANKINQEIRGSRGICSAPRMAPQASGFHTPPLASLLRSGTARLKHKSRDYLTQTLERGGMTDLACSSDVRNQTEQRVLWGGGGRNENREAGDVSARQACAAEIYGAFILLYDSFADPKAQSSSFC